MPTPKKLIESALPVKEISAESMRDKSICNGRGCEEYERGSGDVGVGGKGGVRNK